VTTSKGSDGTTWGYLWEADFASDYTRYISKIPTICTDPWLTGEAENRWSTRRFPTGRTDNHTAGITTTLRRITRQLKRRKNDDVPLPERIRPLPLTSKRRRTKKHDPRRACVANREPKRDDNPAKQHYRKLLKLRYKRSRVRIPELPCNGGIVLFCKAKAKLVWQGRD
jgi:hypothetical protein